ncbi:hypothetical protein CAPTEDRAFT_214455 [Capitella teleta]|uniref:DNA-directed DNA polymerase n=1 Tax=Capitella teleta TaxID=283909 RepID=R7UR38_CAPTE|nr:hypothetical protein CAPTEDRAFT_214455 [Capitella teleta]|eukprot:ELU09004.1 hypothetical protein CAPTEDRAFT_214455 [Capitella teleta]
MERAAPTYSSLAGGTPQRENKCFEMEMEFQRAVAIHMHKEHMHSVSQSNQDLIDRYPGPKSTRPIFQPDWKERLIQASVGVPILPPPVDFASIPDPLLVEDFVDPFAIPTPRAPSPHYVPDRAEALLNVESERENIEIEDYLPDLAPVPDVAPAPSTSGRVMRHHPRRRHNPMRRARPRTGVLQELPMSSEDDSSSSSSSGKKTVGRRLFEFTEHTFKAFGDRQTSIGEIAWINELRRQGHTISTPEDSPSTRVRVTGRSGKRYQPDGINLKTKTVYEYLGNYWHAGDGEKLKATEKKLQDMRDSGWKVIYIWESDFLAEYPHLTQQVADEFYPHHARAYYKGNMQQRKRIRKELMDPHQMAQKVRDGVVFGFAEVDLEKAADEEFHGLFYRRNNRLVNSKEGTKVLLHTPYLATLLKYGYQITRVYTYWEFPRGKPFQSFVDRAMVERKKNSPSAGTWKLLINSFYGGTIMDKRNYNKTCSTSSDTKRGAMVMSPTFRDLIPLGAKSQAHIISSSAFVHLNVPTHLGKTILDLAKLHMVEFYYEVVKKLNGRLISFDTDAFTFALDPSTTILGTMDSATQENKYFDMERAAPTYSSLAGGTPQRENKCFEMEMEFQRAVAIHMHKEHMHSVRQSNQDLIDRYPGPKSTRPIFQPDWKERLIQASVGVPILPPPVDFASIPDPLLVEDFVDPFAIPTPRAPSPHYVPDRAEALLNVESERENIEIEDYLPDLAPVPDVAPAPSTSGRVMRHHPRRRHNPMRRARPRTGVLQELPMSSEDDSSSSSSSGSEESD